MIDKPCPFCGSAVVLAYTVAHNGRAEVNARGWIECSDCGARGPDVDWQPEAWALWNKRSDDTEPTGEAS